jgi:plastocyanin
MRICVAFLGTLVLFQACSKPYKPPPSSESSAADTTVASASSGSHVVAGVVPPAVNGAPSIVVLEPTPLRELPPSEPAAMDQVQRMFTPSVLFARTGQAVEFRNSDDELHNVNVTDDSTKQQMFNVAIIPQTVYRYTFAHEGLYDVHCDIHQTMASLIVASASPYAKLADADGSVQFDDVQPGTYTVTVYSGIRKLEQQIDVSGPSTGINLKS